MGLIRKVLHAAWKWNNRPRKMTPAELVDLLRRMQGNETTHSEWDYFQALALSDPRLEAIRETVVPLYGPGFDASADPILALAIVRAEEVAAADTGNGS
jgi:hypothetical protein